MNLEDRLRSHMHSGEELFVEDGPNAADISAAGTRRTRRNQAGMGLFAGVAVLGLVFGASTLRDDSQPLADGPDRELEDSVVAMEESASAPRAEPEGMVTEIFEGPTAAFDIVVGSGDGFVGLRATNGVFTAIRSDDGVVWDEQPTNLPSGVFVQWLVADGGTFAAAFNAPSGEGFIATSTDLSTWDVVDMAASGTSGAFATSLAVHDGVVVASIESSSEVAEDESARPTSTTALLIGPVGGPYELVQSDTFVGPISSVAITDASIVVSMIGDDESKVVSSFDSGETWVELTETLGGFATVAPLDDDVLAFGLTARVDLGPFRVRRLSPDATTWQPVVVPQEIEAVSWWSSLALSTGETVVLSLQGPGATDDQLNNVLLSLTGDEFAVVDQAAHMTAEQIQNSMLVATSDEEALFMLFGTPTDDPSLASSSGDEPGEGDDATVVPNYVSVPLR